MPKPPADAEIDAALAAAGIAVPPDMQAFVRESCRALKLLATKIAERSGA
jgi:hypothetical protein